MEPKAPTDPVSAPSTAGGYVTSAMNWVTGSILGGKDAAKPAGSAGSAEQSAEPPKSVSSQNVNRVVPSLPTVEWSMEQLEAMGKKEEKPSLAHADSVEDMWAEKPTAAKKEDDWGEGEWSEEEEEKKKDEIAEVGGWGDTNLGFSDEEDEKEKKEDATLALLKEMANKKNEPAPSGTWRERMMCRTEGDEAGEDGADESGRLGGHAGERGQEEGRESEESGEEGEERWVG